MGVAPDGLMVVRAQLCDRIDAIAAELAQLSPSQVAARIDEVRCVARDYGLVPVEAIAQGLESALSGLTACASVRPWLDTMRDAVGCERADPATVQTYLAAIGQRIYG
jgi:hypothetical protein